MKDRGQKERRKKKAPRRMTFIVVPHGRRDEGTRSFEVSYRRLRATGALVLLLVLTWIGMAGSWLWVGSQAARVPGLEGEVTRMEEELAQVGQLGLALRQLEGQYHRMREMLGANRPADPGSIWLPAIGELPLPEPMSDEAAADSVPNAWPLTQRGFVTREHLGVIPGQHPGIDIAVAEGSYVRAAGIGVVIEAGEDDVYGRFVRIKHPEGYESVYGHASELFVVPTDEVERHQVIALSGNTGTSTAPHLHFEIWQDGHAIDPRQIVATP
ncbi:MAG: peptidoglycan DD-metalloendopeptidase family protein [Gemmatimonas sp.]|nr:peptidoglycan DD-metalloendopeptidase family protein [Gemmatimonas sp.]